ncbi:Integral inner nuclear membrane protein ima1 [Paramyrothecium foliicola]|nr:Integral inner nuclear membrane protein ima1 [Paramyrothecium foliicola]
MAWARKARYLICFYCGTKSQTKYDGTNREFACRSCGSTNYLDEVRDNLQLAFHGDIADPPTATEHEAPAARYTVSSTASTSPDSIWCATCLKNQRLFTASLAQYLPDDPSHPDYAELERNYYRFRKSLEQRYPQVCPECAEKADARIRQAGYVAKTDHLRRMMDRTRGRKATRSTTSLDWADTAGRCIWWSGLVLQMLWHIVVMTGLLEHTGHGMYDPDDESWAVVLYENLKRLVNFLPASNRLIDAAITTSILSAWWNPHFVQVNRGFTRHLLGFTQWYSFQGLIIFFRFIFRSVLKFERGTSQTPEAQLGAHSAMAGLMVLIYITASRSIKVDTTPLFKSTPVPVQADVAPGKKIGGGQEQLTNSLSHALDEIDSPPRSAHSSSLDRPATTIRGIPTLTKRQAPASVKPQSGFGSLRLSDSVAPAPPPPAEPGFPDEMDWAPTASQTSPHRAFNDVKPFGAPARSFGEAPTQLNTKPFWYPVPAAPVNPAQRLRNPPVAPLLMSNKVKKEENNFGTTFGVPQDKKKQTEDDGGVTFSQPKFFAPERDADEANSLADLLSQSFTLSQELEDEGTAEDTPVTRPVAAKSKPNVRSIMAARAVTVAVLLASWLLASLAPFSFRTEGQLLVLGVAGAIALHATGDTTRYSGETLGLVAYAESILGVLELAALCWVGWQTWTGAGEVGVYGVFVLGALLGHQLWNAIK